MFVAFNYKEYGMIKITDDDSFLTLVGSLGAIFNGLGRLFWGIMFDKFSFKLISSCINIVLLIFAITLPYLVEIKYLFLIGVCLIYFCYGGNYAVYPTHTVRLFGHELGSKIYYLVFTGFTFGTYNFNIGCLIQWIARLLLVPENNKFEGFKLCFYIFAGFNLISVILSYFIKYEYDEPPHQHRHE